MSIGDFPDSLSQAMLVGIMLVGRLGVRPAVTPARTRCSRRRRGATCSLLRPTLLDVEANRISIITVISTIMIISSSSSSIGSIITTIIISISISIIVVRPTLLDVEPDRRNRRDGLAELHPVEHLVVVVEVVVVVVVGLHPVEQRQKSIHIHQSIFTASNSKKVYWTGILFWI